MCRGMQTTVSKSTVPSELDRQKQISAMWQCMGVVCGKWLSASVSFLVGKGAAALETVERQSGSQWRAPGAPIYSSILHTSGHILNRVPVVQECSSNETMDVMGTLSCNSDP